MIKHSLRLRFLQIFVLLIAISMISFISLAVEPDQKTVQAVINVTPIKGEIGEKVNIYGAGFVPGEKVEIILQITNVSLRWAEANTGGVVIANELGAFKLVPRGGIPKASQYVKPGVYVVKAVGDKGSIAVTPIEILKKVDKD